MTRLHPTARWAVGALLAHHALQNLLQPAAMLSARRTGTALTIPLGRALESTPIWQAALPTAASLLYFVAVWAILKRKATAPAFAVGGFVLEAVGVLLILGQSTYGREISSPLLQREVLLLAAIIALCLAAVVLSRPPRGLESARLHA